MRRGGDTSKPRYHKVGDKIVQYYASEIAEDMREMDKIPDANIPPVLRAR